MLPFLHIGIAFAFFTIIYFLSRRPFKLSNKIASVFLFFLGVPLFFKLVSVGAINLNIPCNILSLRSYLFTYGPLLYLYTKFEISEKPGFKKMYLLHFIPFIVFTLWQFNYPVPEPMPPASVVERCSITGRLILKSIAQPSYRNTGNKPLGFKIKEPPPVEWQFFSPVSKPFTVSQNSERGIITGRLSVDAYNFEHKGEPDSVKYLKTPDDNLPYVEANWKVILFDHISDFLSILSFIIYTLIILRLLQKHKENIPDYFSFYSIRLNLNWLQWLTICFVIAYSFVLITAQVTPQIYTSLLLDRRITPDIALAFFIFAFCFFSVKQPVIFVSENADIEKMTEKKEKKYEKSGLKESEAQYYVGILEEFMRKDKPYLNTDLTIADISVNLNIPRHYLTQVINEKLNKNFFMYINEYRVNHAKEMMLDENFRDYTILRIAYESGFNSKSGFNTIFKKLTGYTPSEYKNNSSQAVYTK